MLSAVLLRVPMHVEIEIRIVKTSTDKNQQSLCCLRYNEDANRYPKDRRTDPEFVVVTSEQVSVVVPGCESEYIILPVLTGNVVSFRCDVIENEPLRKVFRLGHGTMEVEVLSPVSVELVEFANASFEALVDYSAVIRDESHFFKTVHFARTDSGQIVAAYSLAGEFPLVASPDIDLMVEPISSAAAAVLLWMAQGAVQYLGGKLMASILGDPSLSDIVRLINNAVRELEMFIPIAVKKVLDQHEIDKMASLTLALKRDLEQYSGGGNGVTP